MSIVSCRDFRLAQQKPQFLRNQRRSILALRERQEVLPLSSKIKGTRLLAIF
jgi:hypothetical protein